MKSKLSKKTSLVLALAALTGGSAVAFEMPMEDENRGGIPNGGAFVPPGGLYDNEQTNNTTSLVSQDSNGTFEARTADDFVLTQSCNSGQFEVSSVRTHHVINDAFPQNLAVDFFDDNGTGSAPISGITPFATYPQISQTLLGPFGAGTSMFEAEYSTPGLILDVNTVYWISSFGTDAVANETQFATFMAASNGAAGTTANGVIIAPGAGVADWTPVDAVIGPPALAFSFAVDGTCVIAEPEIVSTLSTWNLILMTMLLGGLGLVSTRVFKKH